MSTAIGIVLVLAGSACILEGIYLLGPVIFGLLALCVGIGAIVVAFFILIAAEDKKPPVRS